MRNSGLKFLCKTVALTVATENSAFTSSYAQGSEIQVPIAHHDGNYFVTDAELTMMRDEDRVAFRYSDNPNGSADSIAGVLSSNRRVLGMMPHPERAIEAQMGSADGQALFRALVGQTIAA
jgi:phosphoribosylformylglycinamidine synthase